MISILGLPFAESMSRTKLVTTSRAATWSSSEAFPPCRVCMALVSSSTTSIVIDFNAASRNFLSSSLISWNWEGLVGSSAFVAKIIHEITKLIDYYTWINSPSMANLSKPCMFRGCRGWSSMLAVINLIRWQVCKFCELNFSRNVYLSSWFSDIETFVVFEGLVLCFSKVETNKEDCSTKHYFNTSASLNS